jgi:hypothetical protein
MLVDAAQLRKRNRIMTMMEAPNPLVRASGARFGQRVCIGNSVCVAAMAKFITEWSLDRVLRVSKAG